MKGISFRCNTQEISYSQAVYHHKNVPDENNNLKTWEQCRFKSNIRGPLLSKYKSIVVNDARFRFWNRHCIWGELVGNDQYWSALLVWTTLTDTIGRYIGSIIPISVIGISVKSYRYANPVYKPPLQYPTCSSRRHTNITGKGKKILPCQTRATSHFQLKLNSRNKSCSSAGVNFNADWCAELK